MAGAVPGGIPFAEIESYVRLHGYAEDSDFVAFVVAQDDAWLTHFAARAARAHRGAAPSDDEGGLTDGGQ